MTIELDKGWPEEERRREIGAETEVKKELPPRPYIRSKERFFDIQMEHAEREHRLNEEFAHLHG